MIIVARSFLLLHRIFSISSTSSSTYPVKCKKLLFFRNKRVVFPQLSSIRGGSDGNEEDEDEVNKRDYRISIYSIKGGRNYMEDEYFVSGPTNGHLFAGVFDGHGGNAVSRYLRQNLYAHLQAALPSLISMREIKTRQKRPLVQSLAVEECVNALRYALKKVDDEVQRIRHWSFIGSTAVCIFLVDQGNNLNPVLISANIGDSRAVLSRNGKAIDVTTDHKPNLATEKSRIQGMGGRVTNHGGVYRINGNLALSRAIGDHAERPWVISTPDVQTLPLYTSQESFIIVASDGLWDVMSSQDVVDFISKNSFFQKEKKTNEISKQLVNEALRRGSTDNITVLVIFIN